MLNVGAGELLVIFLVALLVLGPDKLPAAARTIGRVMRQVREVSSGFEREVRNAIHAEDDTPAGGPGTGGDLHPGLGPGPRLGAGDVVLDGNGNGQTANGPTTNGQTTNGQAPRGTGTIRGGPVGTEGPSGSFS
jgi:Tat protein translocase TatB subunit